MTDDEERNERFEEATLDFFLKPSSPSLPSNSKDDSPVAVETKAMKVADIEACVLAPNDAAVATTMEVPDGLPDTPNEVQSTGMESRIFHVLAILQTNVEDVSSLLEDLPADFWNEDEDWEEKPPHNTNEVNIIIRLHYQEYCV